jgi:hypothetical protein
VESTRETRKATVARYITIAIVLSIFVFLGIVASNPLRRPDETIKRRLGKVTPMGSTLEEVAAAAKKRGWYRPRLYSGSSRLATNNITGDLGSYAGFPFKITVIAIWEFDSSNQLTNIQIWRDQDAL